MPEPVLVIACGALAREIVALKERHGWDHLHLRCLDATLHNRPAEIPGRLRDTIEAHRGDYADVFVAYADCGTAGGIDAVLRETGATRLYGAHCYEFFAGRAAFARYAEEAPGTFFLTDFLARHFDRLVIDALALDRHPELRDSYFGHYSRLLYLSQTEDALLLSRARRAADRLGLRFEHRHAGYGELESSLKARLSTMAAGSAHGPQNPDLLA